MTRWSFPVACLVTLAAVAGTPLPNARAAAATTDAPPSGVRLENFDAKVRPQDDFYRHVNGKWLAATEIPPDRASHGAFHMLHDQSERDVRALARRAHLM